MSFYDSSVPLFIHTLNALSKVLDKAEAHASAQNIAPEILLNARLNPTMYPLTKQIQLACDFSGKACARLAQADVPSMPDTETTFAELKARIAKVVDNMKTFKPEQFDGADKRDVTFPSGPGKTTTLPGQQFLNHGTLPNFFFHCVTAYDILRHNGVELAKRDFLGVA